MYKVVFEYADGKRGSCKEGGSVRVFETEREAAYFAKGLNDRIDEDMREAFPVYRVEKDEGESNTETATKKLIYSVYSHEGDMTFIMEDIYDANGEPMSTECVGWYHGEPDERDTETYRGKLKGEYNF